MCYYRRSGRGLLCAQCYVFLAVAVIFFKRSSAQTETVKLVTNQFNLVLLVKPYTAEEAVKQCANDVGLGGPGMLAPATLILYVIQEIISKNTASLQNNTRQDPATYNTGGSSLWVMDPWGGCRAIILPTRLSSYTGAVELSMVPCSWALQSLCIEYDVARALATGLTLPHNQYRTPTPPPLPPPVPYTSGGADAPAPPGYRLVQTGMKLGYSVLPAGAIAFSSRLLYNQYGPVVNVVGRWRATGLDAIRVVHWGDTTGAVEIALAGGNVMPYFGDKASGLLSGAIWTASPLARETVTATAANSTTSVGYSSSSNTSSDGSSSSGALRISYVTRMEGCSSSSAVQRLILVNAGGAVAAQGVARCISNFAEEVAPGGFLAYVEGYYVERPRVTNMSALDAASIVQLWFVWAVPENYTTGATPEAADVTAAPPEESYDVLYDTGGVRSVAPRLEPVVPTPRCEQARPLIPADGGIRGRSECGTLSTEHYACPSYMCCGAARGRIGICGTLASSCLLSSCDPRYGLCGVVPFEALEVTAHEGLTNVAPARSLLSSPPPYTVDVGMGPDARVATTAVRLGTSVFVLDRSSSYQYASAQEHCRSQTLLGLSWQMITIPDAFSFEVSILARTAFLLLLDNRVAWAQPRADNTTSQGPLGCLTVSWDVDVSAVQLVAIQAADCGGSASVICKAAWPSVQASMPQTRHPAPPPSPPPPPPLRPTPPTAAGMGASTAVDVGTTVAAGGVQWTPGGHALSYNLIGIGEPNSGPSCAYSSYEWYLSSQELDTLADISFPPLGNALPTTPVLIGLNVTLTYPIAGIATRPLVLWSAIASDTPAAYQTVGSLAVQYASASTSTTVNTTRPPVVLGSLDGTYLNPNTSYNMSYNVPYMPLSGDIDGVYGGGAAGAAAADVMSYMSAAAGWHGLQLDLARGEVVVEVSGCRGALLELVVFRTSTGRLWSTPVGAACSCSVPFRFQAPKEGYLVAMKVFGGSYVEEVLLIWATPLDSAPSPPVIALASGRKTSRVSRSVLAISIVVAVLMPLPAVAALVAWRLRRSRRAAAAGGSLTDGSPRKKPRKELWWWYRASGSGPDAPCEGDDVAAAGGCDDGANGAAVDDGDGGGRKDPTGCIQLASVLVLRGWASGRAERHTVRAPAGPDPDGSSRANPRDDDSPSSHGLVTHHTKHGGSGGAGEAPAGMCGSIVALDLAPAPASLETPMSTAPERASGNESPYTDICGVSVPASWKQPVQGKDAPDAQAAAFTRVHVGSAGASASAEGGDVIAANGGGPMGKSSDSVTYGSRPRSDAVTGAAGAAAPSSSLSLQLQPLFSSRQGSWAIASTAAGASRDGSAAATDSGAPTKPTRARAATIDGADSNTVVDVPVAASAAALDGSGGPARADSAGLAAGPVQFISCEVRTTLPPAPEPRLPASLSVPPGRPVGPDIWAQQLHDALFHKVLYQWRPNGSGITGGSGDTSGASGAPYGSNPTLSFAAAAPPPSIAPPSSVAAARGVASRSGGGSGGGSNCTAAALGGLAQGPSVTSRGTSGSVVTGNTNYNCITGSSDTGVNGARGRSSPCLDSAGPWTSTGAAGARQSSASQPQVMPSGGQIPFSTLPSPSRVGSHGAPVPEANGMLAPLRPSGQGPGLRPGLSVTESPPGSMLSVPWPPKALSGSPHSMQTVPPARMMASSYASTGSADRSDGTAAAAVGPTAVGIGMASTAFTRGPGAVSVGGVAYAAQVPTGTVAVGVEPVSQQYTAAMAPGGSSRSGTRAFPAAGGGGLGTGGGGGMSGGPALSGGLPLLVLLEPQQQQTRVSEAAVAVAGALAAATGSGGASVAADTAADGSASTSDLLLGRDVLVDTDDPDTYLGHGTSGIVRRGLLRQPDGSLRPVAVKLLNRPNDQAVDAYRKHLKTLLQEMTILGSLRHPNIVQLLGGSVSLSCGASFLVEELCGRTLSHAIYDESTPYSLPRVLRWCVDIACGLAYLHPNIMHRDLKPSNVLLDSAGTAKISDFGLARFKVHTTLVTRDAEVGTTCYMSPECFVSNDYKVTAACDVYSLGVMMNEMVTRTRPWSGVRTAVVGFKVAVVGDRPALPPEDCPLCPPPFRELIQDCWAQHPEERPTSAQVLARLKVMLDEVGGGAREVQEIGQVEEEGGESGTIGKWRDGG